MKVGTRGIRLRGPNLRIEWAIRQNESIANLLKIMDVLNLAKRAWETRQDKKTRLATNSPWLEI